jgi:hypothetical protein
MDISIKEIVAHCSDVKIRKSFLRKTAIHEPSGQPLKKHIFYITDANAFDLSRDIAKESLDSIANFKTVETGKNRVEVFMTPDGEFAAIRLFEYVPHTYAPRTEWAFYNGDKCKPLRILVQTTKK